MESRRDWTAAVIIFAASLTLFLSSPVRPIADSRFQMMYSQHLLWNHSFSFDISAFPEFQSDRPVQSYKRGADFPYQLERFGDRFYCWFPPGSTILSMPYVAVANLMGVSAMDAHGHYNPRGDRKIQVGLAAILMAGLGVITYFTARLFLSIGWSWLITTGTLLGTSVWSIASRSMWIHTWGIFILGVVVWLIARAEVRKRPLHPMLLGTCLAWLYFIRPSDAISILGVTAFVLIRHRRAALPLILTGAIWLAAFVGYSRHHFGRNLPSYYEGQPYLLNFGASLWEGLAGTLVSPARGLFVYSPILLFVGYLLVRYRKYLRPRLTSVALGVACIHILFMGAYKHWHGGHCYGARYCSDVVPWFALLGILAIEARVRWASANQDSSSVWRNRSEWSFASILLGWSIVLNGIGAFSWGAWYWNAKPTNVDYDLARLWDWKHPPFLEPPKGRKSH